MAQRKRFRGQGYFVALLEQLATGLEDTSPADYAFDPSDRWVRTRSPGSWSAHLNFWVGFDDVLSVDADAVRQRCALYASLRYLADDDSVSQARMQAATRDAMEYLLEFRGPGGERVYNVGGIRFQPTATASTYVEAVLSFDMILPR